jgi:hypothetical protein
MELQELLGYMHGIVFLGMHISHLVPWKLLMSSAKCSYVETQCLFFITIAK